jgi:ComF family protein
VCGDISLYGHTCTECRRVTNLDGLITAGPYRHEALRTAVHALKFDGVVSLADPLAAILARYVAKSLAAINADVTNTVLVPLPLHHRRERGRGFNQAELLANALSRGLAIPCLDLLKRVVATPSQTSIIAGVPEARRNNLKGVFTRNEAVSYIPKCAILVDDVATTCASLESASEVLYALGVHSVWGAVVCKG